MERRSYKFPVLVILVLLLTAACAHRSPLTRVPPVGAAPISTSADAVVIPGAAEPVRPELDARVGSRPEIPAARPDSAGTVALPDERAAIDDLAELEIPTDPIDPALRERAEAEVEGLVSGLPIELNSQVLALVDYFSSGRGRRTMETGLQRAGLYQPMMSQILDEEGVPREMIHLAQAESLFRPTALSRAAAKGIWQFIAARGREYGLRQNPWIDERSDPEKSTRAAARHLKDLYDQFGDWYLAMAAYNAGPARVSRAIDRAGSRDFWTLASRGLLPQETRNYVPTILAMTIIGKNPGQYGFGEVAPLPSVEVERVALPQATDLRVVAEYLDVPVEQIRDLNPHVLRWVTPPDDGEFRLRLPLGLAGLFGRTVALLPESERILFREHVVARGETLSRLAGRYGVSVDSIVETNGLASRHMIREGQSLNIPLSGIAQTMPSSPAVAAGAAPSVRPAVYQIRGGDTLTSIAARFGISIEEIKTLNGMSSDLLIAGGSLRLPPAVTLVARSGGDEAPGADEAASGRDEAMERLVYQVRPGDTLYQIASIYQISVDEIRAWNTDADLSVIRPGDQITIYMSR